MMTDQCLRGVMHRTRVQSARVPPDEAAIQRRRRATIENPVKISAPGRGKARMKFVAHFLGFEDRHRVRADMLVQRIADRVRRKGFGKIDMRDLSEGMNTGVRPARALYESLLAAQSERRFFQHSLHAKTVVLTLPADERRTVVFD